MTKIRLTASLRAQIVEARRRANSVYANAVDLDKTVAAALPSVTGPNSPLSQYMKAENAKLIKSIRPAIDARALWGEQLAAQQSEIIKRLAPAFEAMRSAFLPPNLRRIEHLDLEAINEVVSDDGIALYGVPRLSIAKAIIAAPDTAARRQILENNSADISADCRSIAEHYESDAVRELQPFALEALDAFDAGHLAAAQALAANVIDSALNMRFGDDRRRFSPNGSTKTKAAYDEFTVREFIAFGPVWETYQQYRVNKGDPIPTTFSRNATAHNVCQGQYTPVNAIQGLMIACALLYRLDEEHVADDQEPAAS